ncbi:Type 1 glutamine amidotransferase-like domain-containing protein [Streptomyces sp. NBC_00083]|uniref:Type 1 glutamine amidotransferase-like domain-containing protein n=1 Tax=Streptomyces sp. NBC_00083 TaxID=2975647 RepID=UPI00225063E9|nr:Type 1 glutamine amidotransferase-like domain-containing protein [Streptomyces sp. NBC_00083]MCX5386867.1 Type 1 glutamine amidotransferase-like domain-containing protein [Streptomyces sp. NBC_00083]
MPLFLTSIACEVMDQIVVHLNRDPHELKVAFIPTASNPSRTKEGTENDRAKLRDLGFHVTDVDIATTRQEDLRGALRHADVIFVGGGNTFHLLQEARRSGFDTMLREFIDDGTPYIGSSAGSVILGPTIEPIKMMDDPKEAPELDSYDGLGLIDFVPLVHYGNEEFVEEYKTALAELYVAGPRFVLVRDHEFLTVDGDQWRIDG